MHDLQAMPALPGLNGIEQHCWTQFLDCSLNLVAAVNICLKGAHDLSIRDVLLLELLSQPNRREHRLCALAEALRVSQGQLSTQIRRLEAQGWITRSPTRGDPRGILPRITSEGHKRLHAVMETYAQGVRAHYLDQLGREQMLNLVDSCQRINESLSTISTRRRLRVAR
ncbi:MarR family winged helix-turn-helix transcriptional regulator [Mycolicibacter arupensis]|jgi:DNA-binding MarR family transcriptional regulator|uniref:MarR family transcriptional regulator n=2 Tax=Mycolicibacter arupensis TaxID=342002 RepID=A0A0F5MZ50_9MYCO|nr:MarR family transcriptional regulator [Mycolicibacter arupensis]KKC00089.1 MarR family transcriptional regulator [Mycolicibacter arupensis]OQZ95715.1 MarR family transcriptional regulator [Mycolicibacter arupensis]